MSYYPNPNQPASYPYAAYHPAAAGAYGAGYTGYQTSPYATGVTGYGAWPYHPYSYIHPQSIQPRPTIQTTTPAATATTTPTPATPKATTFTSYAPSYNRETVVAPTPVRPRKQANFRGLFTKELRSLMFGFGDDRNPANDTVNVMEEILVEYITDVCLTAGGRKTRLSIEDLRRALSRPADAKKLARMEELLFMQEDIKRARAQFEESDINQSKELV